MRNKKFGSLTGTGMPAVVAGELTWNKWDDGYRLGFGSGRAHGEWENSNEALKRYELERKHDVSRDDWPLGPRWIEGWHVGYAEGQADPRPRITYSERTGNRTKKFTSIWQDEEQAGKEVPAGVWPSKEWHQQTMYDAASKAGRTAGMGDVPIQAAWDAWERENSPWLRDYRQPGGSADYTKLWKAFEYAFLNAPTSRYSSDFSERTGNRTKKFMQYSNAEGELFNIISDAADAQYVYDEDGGPSYKEKLGWAVERMNNAVNQWLLDHGSISPDLTQYAAEVRRHHQASLKERTDHRMKKFGVGNQDFVWRKQLAWDTGLDNGYTSGDTRLSKYDARRRPMLEQWGTLVNTRWQALTRTPEGTEELNRLRLAYEDGWELGKRQSNRDRLPKPPRGYMYSERTPHRFVAPRGLFG